MFCQMDDYRNLEQALDELNVEYDEAQIATDKLNRVQELIVNTDLLFSQEKDGRTRRRKSMGNDLTNASEKLPLPSPPRLANSVHVKDSEIFRLALTKKVQQSEDARRLYEEKVAELKSLVEEIQKEKEMVIQEKDDIVQEKNLVSEERERMMKENTLLKEQLLCIRKEHEEQSDKFEKISRDLSHEKEEKLSLEEELRTSRTEKKKVQNELAEHQDASEFAKKKIERLQKSVDSIQEDLDRKSDQCRVTSSKLSEIQDELELEKNARKEAERKNVELEKEALTQLEQQIERLKKENQDISTGIAAYTEATRSAEEILKKINKKFQNVLGSDHTIGRAAGQSSLDSSFDLSDSTPNQVMECRSEFKRVTNLLYSIDSQFQVLVELKERLERDCEMNEKRASKANLMVDDMKSELEMKTVYGEETTKALEFERARAKDLQQVVEKLFHEQSAAQASYQKATKENFSLREKIVSFREARASKCVHLEHELKKVREAFTFLEREIHQESSVHQVPTIKMMSPAAAAARVDEVEPTMTEETEYGDAEDQEIQDRDVPWSAPSPSAREWPARSPSAREWSASSPTAREFQRCLTPSQRKTSVSWGMFGK